MKILLTGATGYVGRNVAALLIERGNEVVGVIRDHSRRNALSVGVDPLIAKLSDVNLLVEAAQTCDAVIHTGFAGHGIDWFGAVEIERQLITAWVDALAGTNKTLIVSNGTAFLGDSGIGRLDENMPIQSDHPSAARAAAAMAARAEIEGVRGIELRLASFVYGQAGSVFLPQLVNFAKKHGRALYVEDGQTRTSAVHIEAAAKAYICALERGVAGEIYHIACDEEPQVKEIAEAIAIGVGNGCRAESVSQEEAAKLLDPFTAMFMNQNNRLSSLKARRDLGWSPAGYAPLVWDVAHGSYRSEG